MKLYLKKVALRSGIHTNRLFFRFTAGAMLSLCLFAVSVNAMPVMISGISELIGENTDAGILFGYLFFFQYLSFTLVSLGLGYASGRGFSRHTAVVVVSLVAAGICFIGFGVLVRSSATVSAAAMTAGLVAVCVLLGACGGTVEPAVTYLLDKIDRSPHKRMVQLSQFFYCAGAVLSPLTSGLLLKREFTISEIGLVIGCGIIICGIVSGFMFHKGNGSPSPQETAIAEDCSSSADDRSGLKAAAGLRPLFSAAAMMFVYVVIEISLASWIPYHRERISGYSPDNAAFFLAFFWLGLAAARIAYSVVRRIRLKVVMLIHSCIMVLSFIVMSFYDGNFAVLLALYFLCGIGCGPMWPMITSRASETCRSRTHMIYVIAAGSAGACAGPFISSRIIAAFGLRFFFPCLCIFAVCLSAIIIYNNRSSD